VKSTNGIKISESSVSKISSTSPANRLRTAVLKFRHKAVK
jgi:hypothetical protein